MGKAGRVACIFTPYAMTIVSLVLLIILSLGGKNAGSALLNDVYTLQADFSNFTMPSNPNAVATAIKNAKDKGLENIYQVHIYNYCNSVGKDSKTISYCSDFNNGFVFDFVNVWKLNTTAAVANRRQNVAAFNNATAAAQAQIKNLFGQGVADSLDAYKKLARWMNIAYAVALWTTVATVVAGLLAIFSRWGSFITWVLSFVSMVFGFGAAVTGSVVYAGIAGGMQQFVKDYKVYITVGNKFLAYTWISVALSVGATLFWLISICCCSGKSNPHHKDNKGGLWTAEPKGAYEPARGMRVEQTGGYDRMHSPYTGSSDRVPLKPYPSPQPSPYAHDQATGYMQAGNAPQRTGAFEPYRYHN